MIVFTFIGMAVVAAASFVLTALIIAAMIIGIKEIF